MKFCPKCRKEKLSEKFSPSKQTKDGLDGHCRLCRNKYGRLKYLCNPELSNYRKKQYAFKNPWYTSLEHARQRCNNPKHKTFKYYGGRGIQCLLTIEEIKKLWFRDKAWKLKEPSIDRKDNDKDYLFSNCQFIELFLNKSESAKRNNKINKIKSINQYDLNGRFLKTWKSLKEAAKVLGIDYTSISNCLRKKYKSSGGFIWKKTRSLK